MKLDQNLYNNAIEEIISDNSKFQTLQRFLRKLKQKNFFNKIKYDKLYPSGSAPARVYGTPKMRNFSCSDSFPKLRPIVSSIFTFNYNLPISFVIFSSFGNCTSKYIGINY